MENDYILQELILYTAVSLDNYIAREDGSVDWLFTADDYGYPAFYQSVDTTLMGRNTYEQILSFGGEFPYQDTINYVFSRDNKWKDTQHVQFIFGDIIAFTKKLLEKNGRNIWLVGGGQLNTLFLEQGLISELQLFVHPILLGKGIPLFPELHGEQHFNLISCKSYDCGLMHLTYGKQKHG